MSKYPLGLNFNHANHHFTERHHASFYHPRSPSPGKHRTVQQLLRSSPLVTHPSFGDFSQTKQLPTQPLLRQPAQVLQQTASSSYQAQHSASSLQVSSSPVCGHYFSWLSSVLARSDVSTSGISIEGGLRHSRHDRLGLFEGIPLHDDTTFTN